MRSAWIGERWKEMCVGRRMHVLSYCLLMCPTCISFPALVCSLACVHLRQRFAWASACSCMNVCIRMSTHVCSNLPAGVESLQTPRSNWAGRINNDGHWPSIRAHMCSQFLYVLPSEVSNLPSDAQKQTETNSPGFLLPNTTTQTRRISFSKNLEHSDSGSSDTLHST